MLFFDVRFGNLILEVPISKKLSGKRVLHLMALIWVVLLFIHFTIACTKLQQQLVLYGN